MTNASPHDDPIVADMALDTIDRVCADLGLAYFLFGGTCLGFYRDGDYLDDNDLDIAVVSTKEEYKELWGLLAGLPDWNDAAGLRSREIQIDLHYTDSRFPGRQIPSWRPTPYIFREFDSVYHRGTRRNYNVPNPIEDYLDWEFLGSWREPMSRDQWFQIDSWLQKLLGYADEKGIV